MASFNRVILMGNLTRDPELRTLQSGMRVAKLGLAVSENWRDRTTGELKEMVCFVDVDVWDRQADLCAQYLTKGRPVLVEGRLRMDEWTTKEGEKRTKHVVRADNIRFVGSVPQRPEGATAPSAESALTTSGAVEQPPASAYDVNAAAMNDENLPF